MQSSLTWLLMKGFPWAAGLLVAALPLIQEGLKFAGVGCGAVCITRGFGANGSYEAFLASYFLLRSSYIALSSMIDLYSRSAMSALLTRVWKSGKSSMLSWQRRVGLSPPRKRSTFLSLVFTSWIEYLARWLNLFRYSFIVMLPWMRARNSLCLV